MTSPAAARACPPGLRSLSAPLLAATLYVVGFAAWCALAQPGPRPAALGNALVLAPLGPLLGVLIGSIWRRPDLERAARRGWLVIAPALIVSWFGVECQLVEEALTGAPAQLWWVSWLFLTTLPLGLLALCSFPIIPPSPAERLRFWLDSGVILLGGALFLWHFVVRPLASDPQGAGPEFVLALISPAADLVFLFGLARIWLRATDATSRLSLGLFGLGLLLLVVSNAGTDPMMLRGEHLAGTWPSVAFLGALAAMVAGAEAQRRHAPRPQSVRSASPLRLLPYFAILAGSALLVYLALANSADLGPALLAATPLTALVVIRQVLAVRESERLLGERAAAEAAQRSEQRFRALIEQSSDIITVLDRAGVVQYQSPATHRVLGYQVGELSGRSILDLVHPDDRRAAQVALAAIQAGAVQSKVVEVRFRRKDGAWGWLEAIGVNRLDDPLVGGIIVTARDVTERRGLQEQLQHQAMHDPLTGLPNRTLLRDRTDQALRLARREGHPLALMLLDLDRFKDVNDRLGHDVGDRLLEQVARRIQRALRASDTVARLGGDEFAILLPATDETGAQEAAERIGLALGQPFHLAERVLDIGASIGTALFPDHADDTSHLLRCADMAMYAAKRDGGGVAVYTEADGRNNDERIALANDLRRAIERGELVLHYQPKVHLASGALAGAEALVRWRHPERGVLAPDRFIPLAEESGLIVALTEWVLDAAIGQCATWLAAGRRIPIAVNISARDLHAGLSDAVAAVLARHGLGADMLHLEVTETAVLADVGAARTALTRLRDMGVRISVDDFGTGYATLSYLKEFAVHEIKIDRSFVRDLTTNDSDQAIVASTVQLGHRLELTVVAEGVEDEAACRLLQDLGCDQAQGFLLGRPVPADVLSAWEPRADAPPAPALAAPGRAA